MCTRDVCARECVCVSAVGIECTGEATDRLNNNYVVLRGENLIEKNFCGGSDPYVILGPYDEKLKNIPKNKKLKTVVRKSINPFWGSKHEV